MGRNDLYSSRQSATIFGVALETIRNWADEFQDYLSPTATPGRGKHRMYSTDDLRVFSLVAELKKQGLTYADIHAALQNGQRGQPPQLPPDEVQALVVGDQERRLSLEVEYLQRSLMRAQQELDEARTALKEVPQIREEKIRLEARLEAEQKRIEEKEQQIQELRGELTTAQRRIEELLRESGQQYAKGLLEALERRGDLRKENE
ncbi:MAG: MerR family transcriptional regulator [Deltaproteobacteria bacterium]|nr:MerR family transcriptional regulator [Deltaproteobacteria bacterium]